MNEKEILKGAGFGNKMGFGNKPAIVVVDFEVGFTTTNSPLGGDYSKEIENTNQLLDVMRKRDLPVIFTTIGYNADLKDCAAWFMKYSSAVYLSKPENIAIDERLNYNPKQETLIVKKGASSFFGTNLSAILANQSVDTVIIAGVTTSGCVRATAVDSCQYGFRTIVPRECVGDRAKGPHEANLFDIDSKYGDVMSIQDVLAELEKF